MKQGGKAASSLVEVYSIPLEADTARADNLFELLSPEEKERAACFRSSALRRRFIACRGTLREILAGYLEAAPAKVLFNYNLHGKPSVPSSNVQFNVSHSEEWALVAVTHGREVGIDIERIDARFARDQIPERFFSPREVIQLRALPQEQQTDAFFRCWTRKEAYIKARGLGLSLPLDSFEVSLGSEEPALLRGAGDYSVEDIPAPEGFRAAVAAEGSDWSVRLISPASDSKSEQPPTPEYGTYSRRP